MWQLVVYALLALDFILLEIFYWWKNSNFKPSHPHPKKVAVTFSVSKSIYEWPLTTVPFYFNTFRAYRRIHNPVKHLNVFQPLSIFAKSSICNVWQSSKYSSVHLLLHTRDHWHWIKGETSVVNRLSSFYFDFIALLRMLLYGSTVYKKGIKSEKIINMCKWGKAFQEV